RENFLRIRRHRAVGIAHEDVERLERHRLGRERLSGGAALAELAVALPAAVLHEGALPLCRVGGERRSRNQPDEGKRDQPQAHGFRPQRGWVQTLTSAGVPDCTTLTASRSADASCDASLIGPFAHQPIDSASLWYSMSGFSIRVPTGPRSPPLFEGRLRKFARRCTCITSWW